jgi:hypothetical protein
MKYQSAKTVQHLLNLMDLYLACLGFNRPNLGAGFSRKYQTSPVGTQKVQLPLASCEKNWIRSVVSPQGGND